MDNAERQTQPMEEQIQPGLDVSSDKDFPQLESAKSVEKKQKTRREQEMRAHLQNSKHPAVSKS